MTAMTDVFAAPARRCAVLLGASLLAWTAGAGSMPPLTDPANVYADTAAGRLSAAVQGDLERIYVPNLRGNNVSVIDPATLKVVGQFKV
ncbi:MAG: hypothetical protein ACR2I0_08845, partial [Rhodoferax sp.]